MTPKQKLALRNPCFDARETVAAEFGWRMPAPIDRFTVRLTLNIGME